MSSGEPRACPEKREAGEGKWTSVQEEAERTNHTGPQTFLSKEM